MVYTQWLLMAIRKRQRPVSRAEFDRVLRTLDERLVLIEDLQRTCSTQFNRIAQMQAQLDDLQRVVQRRRTVR
jgi:hypothetical protein